MPNRSSEFLPVWDFFEKSTDGSKTAVCNFCRRQFSFKTTITNLKTHLKQKHISAYNILLNSTIPEPQSTNLSLRSETVDLREKNPPSNITSSGSCGHTISDRRTRLSTTKVAQLMFLNVNKIN
jgi:hypothetical protein